MYMSLNVIHVHCANTLYTHSWLILSLCVVESVKDKFTGMVKMIETGDKIKIDQAHLETVIPAISRWSSECTATPTACAHIMLEDT